MLINEMGQGRISNKLYIITIENMNDSHTKKQETLAHKSHSMITSWFSPYTFVKIYTDGCMSRYIS